MLIVNHLSGFGGARGASGDPYFANVVFIANYENDESDVIGHAATLRGNASVSGGGLQLDGSGDMVSYADAADLDCTGDFVYEVFVTGESNGGSYGALGCTYDIDSTDAGKLYQFSYFDTNRFVELYQTGGGSNIATDYNTVTHGVKHHIALVRSGSTAYIYIDGVQKASGTLSGTVGARGLGIGGYSQGAGGSYLKGVVHAARLTVGTTRGYTGASFTVPDDPFPEY